jgi:hypothetical protein
MTIIERRNVMGMFRNFSHPLPPFTSRQQPRESTEGYLLYLYLIKWRNVKEQ